MNSHKYLSGVADAILCIDGAVIFGGYVRDNIIHNMASRKFYEVNKSKGDYDNPNILPETYDRFLLPRDIDCFMRTSDLPKLEEIFKARGIRIITQQDKSLHNYALKTGEFKLTSFMIGLEISPLLKALVSDDLRHMRFAVDVVHHENISGKEPPFNEIDFDCNALIMDGSKQVRLSTRIFSNINYFVDPLERLTRMNDVIQRMVQKQTYAVGKKIAPWRISKMLEKGFELLSEDDAYSLIQPTTKADTCLMCLSHIKDARFKRKCCSAVYHIKCFKQMVQHSNFSGKCPQCRVEISGCELFAGKGLWNSVSND